MWFINYSSPHLFSDEFYISQRTSVEFGEEFDFWISTLEFMCQLSTPRPGPDVGGKLKCHQFCKRFFFSQAKGQSESVIYTPKQRRNRATWSFTTNNKQLQINKCSQSLLIPPWKDWHHPSFQIITIINITKTRVRWTSTKMSWNILRASFSFLITVLCSISAVVECRN